MDQVDVTVIGAGVVGLAVASRLAMTSRSVVVVERAPQAGTGISSRNSGVIHAGLYYPRESLMARLCVDGNRLMYEFCRSHGVHCAPIGKLIVATDPTEERLLAELFESAARNGARDLELLAPREVERLAPHLRATLALHSPSSGIVDVAGYVAALVRQSQDRLAHIAYGTTVTGLERSSSGFLVQTKTLGSPPATHRTRLLVNAAGLEADAIAEMAGLDVDAAGYRQHYYKGEYFALSPAKAKCVSRLVYPVRNPGEPGLGIHLTLDTAGRVFLGPDATPLVGRELDFAVDVSKRKAFANAVQRFAPFIDAEDLQPDRAGIRPKLSSPGRPQRDFVVAHEEARGLAGLVNLIGIESPGLTASLAIAELVARLFHEAGMIH